MNSNLPSDARERVFAAANQIFDESARQNMPTVDQVRRLTVMSPLTLNLTPDLLAATTACTAELLVCLTDIAGEFPGAAFANSFGADDMVIFVLL